MNRLLALISALMLWFTTVSVGVAQPSRDPSMVFIDSIKSLITPQISDSAKAAHYVDMAFIVYNIDSALHYCNTALDLCRPTDTFLIASAHHVMGARYYLRHEMYTSIEHLRKSYNLYNPQRDHRQIVFCCVNLAQGFEALHLPDSVFFYLNQSLESSINRHDTAQIAYSYQNLGRVSTNLTLYENAEEYLMKAIELDSITNNTLDLACDYFWLGCHYIATKSYQKTGHYLRKSIKILESNKYSFSYYANVLHLAYSYMADAYIASAERSGTTRYADSCLVYTKRGGDYFLRYGLNSNYMIARYAYVKYLMFYKKYNEALSVLKECEKYQTGPDLRRDYHKYMTLVYEKLGNYKEALAQQKMHYECAMEYLNDSSLTALADSKTHQALIYKEAEQKQIDEINLVRTHRMQIIIVSLLVVLILASLLIVFVYRMWKIKKKALNILSQKNLILDQQKHEIQSQRDEIENVHTAVLNSIKYSERIQRAAITSERKIKTLFPESFVYYRPRDIVSGDFYYAAQCGKYKVFVVADCTGHGIPGGFLSMLGLSSLKEFLVTEEDAASPGKVLDRMRDFIKDTLGTSDDSGTLLYDGIEMIICSFDIDNHRLVYASAYQNAYIVRNGTAIRLYSDKMPVGRYFHEKAHFATKEEELQTGDMVYLCSDGIQDQPGGHFDIPEGKKLLSKNLLNLLTGIANMPMNQQCTYVDQSLQLWINGREQVDDMTLVGIRI